VTSNGSRSRSPAVAYDEPARYPSTAAVRAIPTKTGFAEVVSRRTFPISRFGTSVPTVISSVAIALVGLA